MTVSKNVVKEYFKITFADKYWLQIRNRGYI